MLRYFSYQFWELVPVSSDTRGLEEANIALGLVMVRLWYISESRPFMLRRVGTYTHFDL